MQVTKKWAKTQRKPDKVIREVRRTCRRREIALVERQNGTSHWVGKTPRGSLVVPRHGELRKGTWYSIYKTIVKLGLAVVVLGILLAWW